MFGRSNDNNVENETFKTTPSSPPEEHPYENPQPIDSDAYDPKSGVKRGLKNRHLSMMALAGIIGPGLLVGAGGALNSGGPASLIIGFGVIGIIAFSIMQSLVSYVGKETSRVIPLSQRCRRKSLRLGSERRASRDGSQDPADILPFLCLRK